jgi:hypothetical protein
MQGTTNERLFGAMTAERLAESVFPGDPTAAGQRPVRVEMLAEALRSAALDFSEKMIRVRDTHCADGVCSELLGSAAVRASREVIGSLGREERKALAEAFRSGLAGFYAHATGCHHAYLKPLGYPGDYQLLDIIYDGGAFPDSSQCTTATGAILDEWVTSTTLPRGLHSRKNALRVWLENAVGVEGDRPVRVASIAAGGARELRELPPAVLRRMDITLIDLDPRSLAFAERALMTKAPDVSVRTIMANVITGDGLEQLHASTYDIIYSFGLFDYIKDDRLLAVAGRFVPRLTPYGRFLFCLKDVRHYDAWFYEFFFDWKFVPRTVLDAPILAEKMGLSVEQSLIMESRAIGVFVCGKPAASLRVGHA